MIFFQIRKNIFSTLLALKDSHLLPTNEGSTSRPPSVILLKNSSGLSCAYLSWTPSLLRFHRCQYCVLQIGIGNCVFHSFATTWSLPFFVKMRLKYNSIRQHHLPKHSVSQARLVYVRINFSAITKFRIFAINVNSFHICK